MKSTAVIVKRHSCVIVVSSPTKFVILKKGHIYLNPNPKQHPQVILSTLVD